MADATRAKELALLPCPFCGWSVTADEGLCKWDKDEFGDTVDEITYTGVCCPGCSASVPINAKTAAEAIAAWNKRPPAATLASIRAELAEALADKARVDELLTAAVDDYDAAREALKPFARVARQIPADAQDKDVTRVVMDEILTAAEMETFAKRGAPVRNAHVELILSLDGLRAKDFRRAARAIAGEQRK